MLTKIFPVAVALAIAIGALTELAFTRTKVYTVTEAMTDAETAIVTIQGKVTKHRDNTYLLRDSTGCVELQTCPTWYRKVELQNNESVVATGEIVKNVALDEGVVYRLATYKIKRHDRPEIIIRTKPGKPPWMLLPHEPQ